MHDNFAFALYEVKQRTVSLVRDPMGVKPLYWWSDGDVMLFASETTSLLRHPALRSSKVNRAGVAQVLVTRYVSRRATLFEGVWRLPEGSCVPFAVNVRLPAMLTRWFVGPWRGLITDVLLFERCLDRGYYDTDVIRGVVDDHVQCRVDRDHVIWVLLALEIWDRLFVHDDGNEAAVTRVKTDFATTLGALVTS